MMPGGERGWSRLVAGGDVGRRWCLGIAALSTTLFVVLVAQLPMAVLAGAGHDDAWFWRRAQAIASGHWLGDYDQLTLMKGAGYPLFLAANHLLGAPLAVSQALLYAAACLLLAHAAWRMGGRRWPALLLLLALQWHPMALEWGRVIRDDIYAAQALLVLGCLLQCLFVARSPRARRGWAVLAGLSLGWFWITREDGIWILPGVAVLLAASALPTWRERAARRGFAIVAALIAVAFAGLLSLVAGANWAKYGRFELVDLKGAAFADALSSLQGVRVGETVPYVPVPGKVRQALYPVSPAFKRLEPYLEGAGRHWTQPGCRTYADTCGDYAGGWFLWALRDGAASVGEYASPERAAAFYRDLHREVEAACATGVLACERSPVDFMPPVSDAQWRTLPARLRRAVSLLLWKDVPPSRLRSHTGQAPTREMWEFVGRPRVPDGVEAQQRWLAGWFHAPGDTWLRLRCAADSAPVALERLPGPDIAVHFRDPSADDRRFQVRLPAEDACVFEVTVAGGVARTLPLSEVDAAARHFPLAEGVLHFDAVGDLVPLSAQAPAWAIAARRAIADVYAAVLPWLAGGGLLAYLWLAARALRRRQLVPLFALATAAWALVASRIALLALVDVSSFPAINVQYMQPAFPLLVLASIASLMALLPGAGAELPPAAPAAVDLRREPA